MFLEGERANWVVNASTEIFRKLDFEWTEERINELKQWWGNGLSATQISARFKGMVSRSAVLGKVHRLNLPARKPRVWPEGVDRTPKPRIVRFKMKQRPLPGVPNPLDLPPPEFAPSTDEPVNFEALQEHHCRFIVSEDGAETLFCGAAREHIGVPYCAYHAKRCYNIQPRR